MSKSSSNEPEEDPYAVLGLTDVTADHHPTDAEITKAYRKLALRLHPDKQQQQQQNGSLSAAERKLRQEQFHSIQQARSFLLDDEYARAREVWKTKRASQHVRKQADRVRETNMSERRKRMREELHRQEAAATTATTSGRSKSGGTGSAGGGAATSTNESASRKRGRHGSSSSSNRDKDKDKKDADLVDRLRRQGQEMRDAYGDREAAASVDRQTAAAEHFKQQQQQRSDKSSAPAPALLEDRQVRLKWSRQRMRTSPSEHSLATTLANQFGCGSVERVEMIGSKGNAALVTFTSADTVSSCVHAYQHSEEMRAAYVGKRKEREAEIMEAKDADAPPPRMRTERARHGENVEDWKLRQAAARERLSRELEEEDGTGTGNGNGAASAVLDTGDDKRAKAKAKTKAARKSSSNKGPSNPFPPPFPSTDDYKNLSPLEKLQHAESLLLKGMVSPERLQRSKVRVLTKQ